MNDKTIIEEIFNAIFSKNELNTCIWNKTKSKYFEKYIPNLKHVFREKWVL